MVQGCYEGYKMKEATAWSKSSEIPHRKLYLACMCSPPPSWLNIYANDWVITLRDLNEASLFEHFIRHSPQSLFYA